jgi:serine/threonine protein kinase
VVAQIRQIRRSHYRLLGLVGHGQFGQVYCAIHRKTGHLVALKHLNKNRFPTHQFLRELRFLLSLEHPNIVTCHALEHSASGRQIVLDYCEGGTLRSILESDIVLTLEEALGFLLDILAGLDHAHRQGIVHCDIKPENILLQLTPGGWVARISDFGIARLSQEVQESAMGHTGSPAYMAPERFYNQHPMASDLYAVGIILYELLLGKRPFSGTPIELMVAHLNQLPPLPDELPEPLKQITGTALQKLLPKRFQSAQAMRQSILQVYQQSQSGHLASGIIGGKVLPAVVPAPELPWVTIPHPIDVMGLALLPNNAASDQEQTRLLITASQDQVWFYHWPSNGAIMPPGPTQGFTLGAPVQQFVPTPQGGMLITPSSLHLLSMTHGLGRIAQEDGPMYTAIAPHGQWFVTCKQPQSASLELLIRHLKSEAGAPIKISAACRVPIAIATGDIVALLPLDTHHLAVVVRQRQQTVFHLVTRRGNYLGPVAIAVPIYNLVATTRPYRYLALEHNCPQSLLIIDLKPFRVVRYRADIAPRWIFETAVGYGVLDQTGHLSLINEEGQILNRVADLPCPVAIAQISARQFLWSVPDSQGSRLYTVDLAQMGLDLVF